MFFDKLRQEDIYGPYKPPEIPSGFPVEIGIELYNLDVSNEKAVEEVMEKYKLNDNPDPQLRLTTEEFINTLKTQIIPMTNKAIVGDEPDPKDISKLEFYLLGEERPIYTTGPLDTGRYSNLAENEIGRFIIEEDIVINEDPLWKIYEWIFLVWNLAIKVRRCAAPDCNVIFIPKRIDQQYHEKRCAKRVWAQNHN